MSTTKRRFVASEALTDDTQVLGVPVKEWNKAFVGNFEKSLGVVKNRTEFTKQVNEVDWDAGKRLRAARRVAANSNQEAAPDERTQKRTAGVSR